MSEAIDKHLHNPSRQKHDLVILKEVLARPDASEQSLRNQEFYELRILDWSNSWRPGFEVVQWRIRWSEIDKQFMGVAEESDLCSSQGSAKDRYNARLTALKAMGFVTTDIDP